MRSPQTTVGSGGGCRGILFIMVSREHRRRRRLRLRHRCRHRPMTVEKQSVAHEVGAIHKKLLSRKKIGSPFASRRFMFLFY